MLRPEPEKLEQAAKLREMGLGWNTIIQRTGLSLFVLRSNLEPDFAARRKMAAAVSRARRRSGYTRPLLKKADMIRLSDPDGKNPFGHYAIGDRVFPVTVPADAEEERQRYLAYQHPTLTAQILGDPPYWRSALAKKGISP